MMDTIFYRRFAPLIAGSIGIVLITIGMLLISYKVMEQKPEDNDDLFQLFQRIREPQMMIDATFSGVALSPKGILYSTYDRSVERGRRVCPT